MKEQKIDINQIIESVIKSKLFNPEEQKVLSDLFVKEGQSDVFFDRCEEMFKAAIERAAQQSKSFIINFEEQTETAEKEMEEKKTALAKDLQDKMSKLADDDFEQKSKIMEEYNQTTLTQYEQLEEKIREIGAKAMLEVAYLDEDNQQN